jgi:hypothetical protein
MNERHLVYALAAALVGAYLAVPSLWLSDVIIFSLVLGGITLGILTLRGRRSPR